jgi:hypothetical protein
MLGGGRLQRGLGSAWAAAGRRPKARPIPRSGVFSTFMSFFSQKHIAVFMLILYIA